MAQQQNDGEPISDEVVLSAVDDVDAEVDALRASPTFQKFLDVRCRPTRTRSFSEYSRELDEELKRESLAHESAKS